MKRSKLLLGIFGLLTIFGLASWSESQEPAPESKDPVQVQTRGPLHEAYAQPFDVKPEPGPTAPKEPPPPLPEVPPEQKPDMDNAQWIPGYWAWDAQRQDYLWISGVYRVAPQNRQYVPGYWTGSGESWRWVAGFWSNPQQDVPYTPEPPATLDNGPQQPAPDDSSMYIPGNWIYSDSRFIWRPGYYAPIQTARVWNPAHYVWTPNGYLFVDGYWDLPFDQRGLIFAPVYFNQPLWQNPGWSYQPNYVVGYNSFLNNAFIGRGGSFYFGNYYGSNYGGLGYRPWYSGRGRYDPLFAHYGYQNHRNNPNWIANTQQRYVAMGAGGVIPPPINFSQQNVFAKTKGAPPMVTPLNQFKSNQVKLVNASATQVKTQQASAQQTRQIAATRQKIETASTNVANRSVEGRALRIQAPTTASGPSVVNHAGANGPQIVNHAPKGTNLNSTHVPQITPKSSPATTLPGVRIINSQPAAHANPVPRIVNTAPHTIQPSAPRIVNSVPHTIQPSAPRITNSVPHTIQPSAPRISAPAPHIMHSAPAPRSMPSAPAHIGGAMHGGGGHRR